MARIVVIGGSGHVGGYLVPHLVEGGHDVVNVTRGQQAPYRGHSAWAQVQQVTLDREVEEAAGTFGAKIADLGGEIVIDMICFTLDSAKHIVESLQGRVSHFLHTGTIWVHGHSLSTPTREADPRAPYGEYGVQKSLIEDYLLLHARRTGFPATVVRPGHIVGPGWEPLNPLGNFNVGAFGTIARGARLVLPNLGLETVHHVHAEDVAQVFWRSIDRPSASIGEQFNAVSEQAVTLRGFAEAMYRWHGHMPDLGFAPFDEWAKEHSAADADATLEHIGRSPCHSIGKARDLLGYHPRHTSLQAIQEAVTWLMQQGVIET
ncbi:epimerase [Actibacterium mucosum KCTC 23349]|uniref:Epimerase n=1 Tax=Actibacterium mucosum KCTC 23349 TaxID=1454373 RepID=A0A037ZIW2_9RHOB|nr:NAD-dependent epimerase/dehydratase family protein [Actibacterium mucosum]KAJ55472.1 epimerase [Actibacterium mucosum KCTC 23349]